MKRQLRSLLFAILLCIMAVIPVSAAAVSRVVDDADILSTAKESELKAQLDEISSRQGMDVAVVTVVNLGDYDSVEAYADDYYDKNGYADDGILLLVSMKERKWHMSTKGFGVTAFTDAGLEYVSEQFQGNLSDGDYSKAFQTFASTCDEFISQAKSGKAYDVGNMPKKPMSPVWIPISLGIGIFIAFVVTSSMRASLKSVALKKTASDYVQKDSLRLTRSRDIYLYQEIMRTERPKESESSDGGGSSTHTSSSGSSHGGMSGSF